MWTRHVEHLLTRYCDGDLPVADVQRVDAHLATCVRCRSAHEDIRFSATLVRQLSTVTAPPSVWAGIDAALSQPRRDGWLMPGVAVRWAFACVVVLAAASVMWSLRNGASGPWEV